MTLKEQQEQIDHLQKRIGTLVDELRITQADVKNFKEAVARDMKRTIDLIKKKK